MQTDITQMGRWSSFQPFVTTPTRPKIAPGRPTLKPIPFQRILKPLQHQFYRINWAIQWFWRQYPLQRTFWLKPGGLTWRLIAMILLARVILRRTAPKPLTASSIAHSTDCRPSLKPVAMTCWRRAINHLVVITGLSWHLDEHPIGISKWGLRAIKVNWSVVFANDTGSASY